MPRERMLVLACSKKLGARCVAGISLNSGKWVRPVSTPNGGALSTFHCGFDGRYPMLREVVTFPTQSACPLPAQPENVLVGHGGWQLERRLTREETAALVEPYLVEGPDLLRGLGGSVSEAAVAAEPVDASLAVLDPEQLEFEHEIVPWGNGSRQWADFMLGGAHHRVRLTDMVVRPRLLKLDPGMYALGDIVDKPPSRVALTVSLGEAFNGQHYKLGAAVVGLG